MSDLESGKFIAWDEVVQDIFKKLNDNKQYTMDNFIHEIYLQINDYGADSFKNEEETKNFAKELSEKIINNMGIDNPEEV